MSDNYEHYNRYARILLNNVLLKNSNNTKDIKKKYLLVEGETDSNFIEPVKNVDVECIVAARKIADNNIFYGIAAEEGRDSAKNAIYLVMKARSQFPAKVKWPGDSNIVPIYGLIDKDFDEEDKFQDISNLFVTYTHDLETMIILTDRNTIFSRIDGCNFTADEISNAECLAYELAIIRKAVRLSTGKIGYNFDHSVLNDKHGFVQFDEFCSGFEIVPQLAIEYIAEHQNIVEYGVVETFKKTLFLYLEPYLNEKKRFLFINDEFDPFDIENFWNDVNGHDYLAALAYVNEKAYEKFQNDNIKGLCRKFELAIIAACDYKKITRNHPYSDMKTAGLIC